MIKYKELFEKIEVSDYQKKKTEIGMKKYNINQKDIDKARKALSKERKIDEKYIEFAFVNEMSDEPPIVFLSFHIMDKSSKYYKSTINYRFI